MNTIREQQQQQQQPPALLNQHGGRSNNNESVNLRQTHLTKFAFLLSSARGEGSDEPVVGMHHDVEMAACFSERHMYGSGGGQGGSCNNGGMMLMTMPVTPPSISSSSLSMQSKNGQTLSSKRKSTLMEMAAMNMSTPFYTTPDTVSSTAKTILKNIVTTMEELMDSRLRSTVSQLVHRAGGISNSPLLFRLLSPSRKRIQVATVITRFVLPNENDENQQQASSTGSASSTEELLSIPLQFKAILDIKIFGVVSTVELSAPVTMSGKFDNQDGLLTAVDVSFDCVNLLKVMIAQARSVVKTAVTKAAALSVQIAEWDAKKKNLAATVSSLRKTNAASAHSLHSLLGSGMSLNSLASIDGGATLCSTLFTSFPSLSNANKLAMQQQKSVSKGVLRESSRGLPRAYSRNNNNTMSLLLKSRNHLGNYSSSNNANETFDFGGGGANHNSNTINTLGGRTASTANVVRFRMPNVSSPTSPPPSASTSSSSPPKAPQHQVQQQEPQQQEQADKGNIHAGLFSWLQDDKMFLTEEKIQEQNAADAECERKLREAPMPLRFFTAAEDLGGGECSLEIVSKSIFGGSSSLESNGGQLQEKRRQQGQGPRNPKRRKVWP
mmetsp:Transcript_24834/g.44666  ORF Transcript_24834/g.44666 Transcript_24834/m.44666 type:complete len:610 (-) Transcript_24834:56-1885(-)